MYFEVQFDGALVDDQSGTFVKDGSEISYHKARFTCLQDNSLLKLSVPDSAPALPSAMDLVTITVGVTVAERYVKAEYVGFHDSEPAVF